MKKSLIIFKLWLRILIDSFQNIIGWIRGYKQILLCRFIQKKVTRQLVIILINGDHWWVLKIDRNCILIRLAQITHAITPLCWWVKYNVRCTVAAIDTIYSICLLHIRCCRFLYQYCYHFLKHHKLQFDLFLRRYLYVLFV